MNSLPISQLLVEALANGGCQGIVLTLGVATVMRFLPRTNAATRYAVWLGCLLMVAALPVIHGIGSSWATVMDGKSGTEGLSPADAVTSEDAVETDATGHGVLPAVMGTDDSEWNGVVHAPEWTPGPRDALDSGASVAPIERSPLSEPMRSNGLSEEALELPGAYGRVALFAEHRWNLGLPPAALVALLAAWAAVAAWRLGRLGWECIQVRNVKRGAVAADEASEAVFARIAGNLGLVRPVCLRIGPAEGVPLVAGFGRPAVILPAGFLASNSAEQVAQVLRHELAHVQRWDDVSNLIQQAIAAVLFFHPAVWWLSERLALDREIACDDHVLAATRQARPYALLLAEFAGRRSRDLIAAPAIRNRRTQLKERIAMILDSKRNASPRMAGTMAGVLLALVAGFTGIVLHAAPRVALANVSADEVGAGGPSGRVTDVQVSVESEVAEPVILVHPAPDAVGLAVLVTDDATPPRHKTPALGLPPPPPEPALPPSPAVPPRVTGVSRSVVIESGDHSSLEQRLDRLERLVEKLVPEGKSRSGKPPAPEGSTDFKFNINRDAYIQRSEDGRRSAAWDIRSGAESAEVGKSAKKTAEINEYAHRLAERAAREPKQELARAQREQERQERLNSRMAEEQGRQEAHATLNGRQQMEIQRKALESARRALEKELESLDHRLERLGEEQERLEEQRKSLQEQEEKRDRQAAKVKSTPSPEAEPKAGNPPGADLVKP